jgi:hypothetical protein
MALFRKFFFIHRCGNKLIDARCPSGTNTTKAPLNNYARNVIYKSIWKLVNHYRAWRSGTLLIKNT